MQQTDTVNGEHDPDFRPGDVLHDGTIADRALWWHGMKLRDWPPTVESRQAELNEVSRMWSAWAETATTDTVPDIYKGERLPDGTVADRPWWYHPGANYPLRDWPPDHEPPPNGVTFSRRTPDET